MSQKSSTSQSSQVSSQRNGSIPINLIDSDFIDKCPRDFEYIPTCRFINRPKKSYKSLIKSKTDQLIKFNNMTRTFARQRAENEIISLCFCIRIPGFPACFDANCLNRRCRIECHPKWCPHKSCINQRFRKQQVAKIKIFDTNTVKGAGIKTLEPLKVGDFIGEYAGERVNDQEARARLLKYKSENRRHFYLMKIGQNDSVDPTVIGNFGRFLNHSCNPNCETQLWTVDGELLVGVFALKSINAGDELTYDYRYTRDENSSEQLPCLCGASNCSGIFGVRPKKNDLRTKKSSFKPTGGSVKGKKTFVSKRHQIDSALIPHYPLPSNHSAIAQTHKIFLPRNVKKVFYFLNKTLCHQEFAYLSRHAQCSDQGMSQLKSLYSQQAELRSSPLDLFTPSKFHNPLNIIPSPFYPGNPHEFLLPQRFCELIESKTDRQAAWDVVALDILQSWIKQVPNTNKSLSKHPWPASVYGRGQIKIFDLNLSEFERDLNSSQIRQTGQRQKRRNGTLGSGSSPLFSFMTPVSSSKSSLPQVPIDIYGRRCTNHNTNKAIKSKFKSHQKTSPEITLATQAAECIWRWYVPKHVTISNLVEAIHQGPPIL